MRAADVVVTKPGYGIISECIANDTAILYTSRGALSRIRGAGAGDAEVSARGIYRARTICWPAVGAIAGEGARFTGASDQARRQRRGRGRK